MSGTTKKTDAKSKSKPSKGVKSAAVKTAARTTTSVKKTSKKSAATSTRSAKTTKPAKSSKPLARKKTAAPKASTVVKDVPSLHQPAAPRVAHIPKSAVGEFWMWVAFFFTFLFIYSISENVLNVGTGTDSSLSIYAFIPAVLIAIGVWRANRTKSTYTGMVIVLSMLTAGMFIWLFGLTSASKLLFS